MLSVIKKKSKKLQTCSDRGGCGWQCTLHQNNDGNELSFPSLFNFFYFILLVKVRVSFSPLSSFLWLSQGFVPSLLSFSSSLFLKLNFFSSLFEERTCLSLFLIFELVFLYFSFFLLLTVLVIYFLYTFLPSLSLSSSPLHPTPLLPATTSYPSHLSYRRCQPSSPILYLRRTVAASHLLHFYRWLNPDIYRQAQPTQKSRKMNRTAPNIRFDLYETCGSVRFVLFLFYIFGFQ